MAILHFIVCFCVFQALSVFAYSTTKQCSPSHPTLMKIENQYDMEVSELGYNITYDYMYKITETPSMNTTQIHFESVDVNISGHFYPKEKYADFKIDRKMSTGAFTVNRTVENFGSKNVKVTCKVVESDQLLPKSISQTKESMSQKERAKSSVYALIVNCLETQICDQYDAIISHDFLEHNKLEESLSMLVKDYYDQKDLEKVKIQQEKNLQIAINSVFDFGVAVGITKWVDNNGIFHVSQIEKEFSYLGISGEFTATDISFDGLTSFRRTSDMVFSNDKNRYTMGTTVRLPKARVNIPSYYVRYGFKEVKGHLKVDIKGLSLKIRVSVDYNADPCKIHLDEMIIYEVGDVNVNFAGLGMVWDKLAMEPIIRYTIRNYIFEKGKEAIVEGVSKLNCETFRPTFELKNNNSL